MRGSKLAWWFWGGFFLMAGLTIALVLAAVLQQEKNGDEASSPGRLEPQTVAKPELPAETSANKLSMLLTNANKAALEAAELQVLALLDAAYEPVYTAVPKYADFHYSVWGEYAELTEAALGDVSSKLQEMLFSGLEGRLEGVAIELDEIFNSVFQAELRTASSATSDFSFDLGPITSQALDDAANRMLVTVPVAAVASVGSGLALKTAAAAMAKKIAAKLAVKAATKTGGKLAAIGSGVGIGAAACSWSGPGAALCAAVGGAGAWIVADYGIVKLDEYWNRDEFEADLRAMIDTEKAAHADLLRNSLLNRAVAVQDLSAEIIQQHDFTLRELSGSGNAEVCKTAIELNARYELMREHLRERTPEAVDALLGDVTVYAGSYSLGRMVGELQQNLSEAPYITISEAQLSGNLPKDYRADRDVSGKLFLNGGSFDFARTPVAEDSGFRIEIAPELEVSAARNFDFGIALEQHRFWGNRYFSGAGTVDLLDAVGAISGLDHEVFLPFSIAYDEVPREMEGLIVRSDSAPGVVLKLRFHARPMAALEKAPKCE